MGTSASLNVIGPTSSAPKLAPSLLPPQLLPAPALHYQVLPPVQSLTSQPVKRKAPTPPAPLPSKRGAFDPAELPSDLGDLIVRDASALKQLGWHGLVNQRRPTSDFSSLDNLPHPARRLLRSYAH